MRATKLLLWSTLCLTILIPSVQAAHSPIRYLTRAEAAELLLKARFDELPERISTRSYPDITENQTTTPYVLYATDIGMLDSEPERGLIFPYRSVTRAEFLKMMTIAFSLPTFMPYAFSDIDIKTWVASYAGIAYHYKLFPDALKSRELKPALRITHLEAAQALERFLLKEPYRKAKNFNVYAKIPSPASRVLATPNLVKQTMIRLFQYHGEGRPEKTRFEAISLTNQERNTHGLPPLQENYLLRLSAQKHARDMYKRGYFSHYTPEGLDYVDRIRAENYLRVDQSQCGCRIVFHLGALMEQGRINTTPNSMTTETEVCGCRPRFAVGENIAKGQLTPKEVTEDWMNSPPHRRNILHKDFDEIGIGIYGDVWAQNFGRVWVE